MKHYTFEGYNIDQGPGCLYVILEVMFYILLAAVVIKEIGLWIAHI